MEVYSRRDFSKGINSRIYGTGVLNSDSEKLSATLELVINNNLLH